MYTTTTPMAWGTKARKENVSLFQLFNSIWRLLFLKDVIFQNYSRFMNIVHYWKHWSNYNLVVIRSFRSAVFMLMVQARYFSPPSPSGTVIKYLRHRGACYGHLGSFISFMDKFAYGRLLLLIFSSFWSATHAHTICIACASSRYPSTITCHIPF